LKSFNLNINNNIQLDEAFLSGSNDIATGGLIPGALEVTGSYSLQFENTTELAKYEANTKNAVIATFTGADIGEANNGVEQIKISLGRIVLTKPPITYNIDGLVILEQEFTVEFEATDGDIEVVVTNEVENASNATYAPA